MKKFIGLLNSKRGFTLVEVIAALLISSIILGPALYYLFDAQNENIANQRLMEAQLQGDSAIKAIFDDLRKVVSSSTRLDDPTLGDKTIETGTIPTTTIKVIVIRFSDTSQVAYGVVSNKLYKYVKSTKIDINTLTTADLSTGQAILNNVQTFDPNTVDNSITDPVTHTITHTTSYKISLQIKPNDVGKLQVRPVSITNTFTPRFDMNIR